MSPTSDQQLREKFSSARVENLGRITVSLMTGILSVLVVFGSFEASASNLWIFGNFGFFALAFLFSIIAHELGHALAAILVGYRVFRIAIGTGAVIRNWKCGGTEVEVRRFPVLAYVAMEPGPPEKDNAWKAAFVYLAGPAMNLILFLVLRSVVPVGVLGSLSGIATRPIPLQMGMYINLMFLVSSLPLRTSHGMLEFTDGFRLLRAMRDSKKEIDSIRADRPILAGRDQLNQGSMEKAEDILKDALTPDSRSRLVELELISVQIAKGEFSQAQTALQGILEDDTDMDSIELLTAWNSLAYCFALSGDMGKLEQASYISEITHRAARGIPAILTTRGAVLTLDGKISKGRRLLRRAFRRDACRLPRARSAAWIAYGHAVSGELDQAGRWLSTATNSLEKLPEIGLVQSVIKQAKPRE